MSGLEWVAIPAGAFWMGSSGGDADESPLQRIALRAFHITRTPVTNAQYLEFVRATGYPAPGHCANGKVPPGLEQHPVTYVDWFTACAFARWRKARLPTEAEWEKAARGPAEGGEPRISPWGDAEPDATRANYHAHPFRVAHLRTTSPVGEYPAGASPYGVLDLAGNVWEWVSSLYKEYPYRADDGREDGGAGEMRGAEGMRVVRGGSYIHPAREIRCAYRHRFFPTACDPYIGFRLAR